MLSPNAITVLEKRYVRKGDQGTPAETPEGLFRRVALALAEGDRAHGAADAQVAATADQFFALMWALDFLPNSPTLANAGTPLGQLSACFVLPVPDDLAGIFETIKHAALIHQTGGGTGFAFSRLRPKNDLVNSTRGVSSGPVSFMRVFNAATESIKQGGMRRGANMGILRVDHPDILEFIDLKADLAEMTNFNVSVALTDAFMAAVEAGTTYPLVNPRTGAIAGELAARDVFRRIVNRAWATGEPGVIFIDRMNRYCPVPWLGEYEACNPCAEQNLLPYESCNLGSINLENFVIRRSAHAGGTASGTVPAIDWERLRLAVQVSMHLLDNVITVNKFPLAQLQAMSDATRKVGLGVMGFGRMLFKLGVAYGSEESFVLAEKVMSFLDYESKLASVKLAMARGQYPARDGHEAESNAIYRRWCLERDAEEHKHRDCDYALLADLIDRHGIRNSTTTTVAPTGTLSIIAGTSGGCEPVFALAFKRYQADTHMLDADPEFAGSLEAAGFPKAAIAEVFAGIDAHHGSLRAYLAAAPDALSPALATRLHELAAVYVGAHDVTPEAHVAIQAAFQKFNDSSLSKTCNLPATATVEDAMAAYRLAWESGCKGITIYRDGARENQPLSTSQTKHAPPSPTGIPAVTLTVSTLPPRVAPGDRQPRRRPEDLYGFTRTTQTGDGKLYTTVNYDEEGLREVVTNLGRSGGTLFSLAEAIGRLISLALQYRVPVEEISKQLVGIRSAVAHGIGPAQVLSIPDAIGKVLATAPRTLIGFVGPALAPVLEEAGEPVAACHPVEVLGHSPECPECNTRLSFGEGCTTCPHCGYSKCG